MEDTQITKKNVTISADGGVIYNFGKKKIVANCEELLDDPVWKDILLNKWICLDNGDERPAHTFIKHSFNNNRLIQIIYSGEGVYYDGVYKLYKVKVYTFKDGTVFIDPLEYAVSYGSLNVPGGMKYLDRLVQDGYITLKENLVRPESIRDVCKKPSSGA